MMKSIPARIYQYIDKYYTVEIEVSSWTTVYDNLQKLLRERGIIEKSRFVSIDIVDGIFVFSVGHGRQVFLYNKRPIIITRSNRSEHYSEELIKIKTFGRSKSLANSLLKESSLIYKDNNTLDVYIPEKNRRAFIAEITKRNYDTVFMNHNEKIKLINKINDFKGYDTKRKELGLPHHLGIMLYGEPGTGKTSLARAIASDLNLPIIMCSTTYELEDACISNYKGIIIVDEADSILSSDFDEAIKEDVERKGVSNMSEYVGSDSNRAKILKALDGILTKHGNIVIFITNHIEKFDTAIMRRGRIDVMVKMDKLSNDEMINEIMKTLIVDRAQLKKDLDDDISVDEILIKYPFK